MKLHSLAIIGIAIILPMTIILSAYTASQAKTLNYQVLYDSKLIGATYDGVKALQLNMSNSTTSDLINSKIRDIRASIKTFYGSLSSHFDMAGYGEDVLKTYVPAIVYTMYDGYYIYSAYNNTLDPDDVFYTGAVYEDDEMLYGLKPYIYYSCRYRHNTSDEFVITYSLDSYITIQGRIRGEAINESGYLLTGVNNAGNSYRGVQIVPESVSSGIFNQNVYLPDNYTGHTQIDVRGHPSGSIKTLPQVKFNGVKYYQDTDGQVFAMINDERYNQKNINADHYVTNNNGVKFYEDAAKFRERITYLGLDDLTSDDAVDPKGEYYKNYGENSPFPINRKIFEELYNSPTGGPFIEDENSEFSAHKMEVIKNSMETNLMAAISNYNKVSSASVNFTMPKLTDAEWEQISQNVTMITFMQGLSIGGKMYNGHAIVANEMTEDYISEDSIYLVTADGEYCRPMDSKLLTKNIQGGVLDSDVERKTTFAIIPHSDSKVDSNKNEIYYYPKTEEASYTSVVDRNVGITNPLVRKANGTKKTLHEYLGEHPTIASKYYTALGRERYSQYRVMNKLEEVQENKENG